MQEQVLSSDDATAVVHLYCIFSAGKFRTFGCSFESMYCNSMELWYLTAYGKYFPNSVSDLTLIGSLCVIDK